jgi:hypothetical protein
MENKNRRKYHETITEEEMRYLKESVNSILDPEFPIKVLLKDKKRTK